MSSIYDLGTFSYVPGSFSVTTHASDVEDLIVKTKQNTFTKTHTEKHQLSHVTQNNKHVIKTEYTKDGTLYT